MEIRSIITMTREEFNNLYISKQVNYFNEKLKDKDNNFNKLCKDIGISKNTILNRFKNNGYTACKDGQRIISFTNDNSNNEYAAAKDNNNLDNKNVVTKENKDVTGKANDPKDIDSILKRIEMLEEDIKKIKNENQKEVNNNFILGDFSGTTTTRTFKIDVRVNKELEQFLNKYSMYKKQDVISTLLKFAIDNIE